jgi:two-component system sensor histidine kinase QseC
MRSIRRQVLVWVLGVLVSTLLVMLYISYNKALHEIEEIFDAELAQAARLIAKLPLADIDSKGSVSPITVAQDDSEKHKYEQYISYQLWYKGELLLRSAFAPMEALGNEEGFQDKDTGGKRWRVFGLHPEDSDFQIFTAEDTAAREELSWYFAVESLGIIFWAIPVFALIIGITVDRGLRPLKKLSTEVANRDIYQLTPVVDKDTPKELLPLTNALNALLIRLDEAISRERRFTADASHELRTPLSAIRLYSQLAMRANSVEDGRQSLEKVIGAVDQSTHLVEQLLTLARMSHEGEDVEMEEIEMTDLCNTLKDQLSEPAAQKGIRIVADHSIGELNPIRSNLSLLHTILRNLLDNAIRYSFENTEIYCKVTQDGTGTLISIQDGGPGIPEDQLGKVQERFTRLAGQDIVGCGLGLSIVSQAVECIGARLILKNRADGQTGLIATVILPG